MLKVFLEYKVGHYKMSGYLLESDQRHYRIVKPVMLELSDPYSSDELRQDVEPTFQIQSEQIVYFHETLTKELRRHGLIRPEPSMELLDEKNKRIEELSALLKSAISQGIAGKNMNIKSATEVDDK